jgi:hypothetical protein
MNILNKINKIELSKEKSFSHIIKQDQDTYCCVCFIEKHYIYNIDGDNILSLADIENNYFENDEIPNELLIKSTCNKHFICINCIKKLVNNYENHPINDTNSHFACPYPFEDCVTSIGFKNIFDHHLIKKICNVQEWSNYISHAENYAFPGYTIIKCPVSYYKRGDRILCNTEILLENNEIRDASTGDFIVDCTQNPDCLKRFCFNCKQTMSYYQTDCFDCKTTYENENPFVFNYYFNKMSQLVDKINETDDSTIINYQESSYLYKNNEITDEIAVEQILNVIKDTNSYFICPICKISLYKTERCNGLSHHNIERCYACGRIGFKTRGLGEHWNTNGLGGCFRFDHDAYIKQYIPEYKCNENHCSNHDRGDCIIKDHQIGIEKLQETRKYAYVYHMLKSLLINTRFQVYDILYDRLKGTDDIKYLPYKQTLMLLSKFKSYNKNYCENVFYNTINCTHPKNIQDFSEKNYTIDCDEFLNTYALKINTIDPYYNYNYNYLSGTNFTITNNDDDNLSIDSSSGLLTNTTHTQTNTDTLTNSDTLTNNNTINNFMQITVTNDIGSRILEEIIFELDNYNTQQNNIQQTDTQQTDTQQTDTLNRTNTEIHNDISFNLTNITSENIIQNVINQNVINQNVINQNVINQNVINSDDEHFNIRVNHYCLMYDSEEDE